jgi:hypothetical protein
MDFLQWAARITTASLPHLWNIPCTIQPKEIAMLRTPPIRNLLFTAAAISLFGSTAYAGYMFESPTLYEQTDGAVTYVTGGIGERETAELEAAKAYYNVHITNAEKSGAYVSDTSVVIQDRKGRDMIATNTGPLLLVNLPAGRYTLLAENSGIVQERHFTVSAKKPTKLHVTWKSQE